MNRKLHNSYTHFQGRLAEGGFDVDVTSLRKSYRCSRSVCSFITNSLGISIDSHRSDSTKVEIVDSMDKLVELFSDEEIVKLFYQEHHTNGCLSRNWGEVKGEDCYYNVCVILTKKASELLVKNELFT